MAKNAQSGSIPRFRVCWSCYPCGTFCSEFWGSCLSRRFFGRARRSVSLSPTAAKAQVMARARRQEQITFQDLGVGDCFRFLPDDQDGEVDVWRKTTERSFVKSGRLDIPESTWGRAIPENSYILRSITVHPEHRVILCRCPQSRRRHR